MRALALAVTLVAALASPAAAAKEDPVPPPPPPPTCNLVVDPIGDTPVRTTHLDIRGGDIATDLTRVHAVARLASLSASDPVAELGARWDVSFSVSGGGRYTFTARRDAIGTTTATLSRDLGGVSVVVSPATLSFDFTSNEIVFSAPRKAVAELPAIIGKTMLYAITVDTYAGPTDVEVDTAGPMGRYFDGNPSCISA